MNAVGITAASLAVGLAAIATCAAISRKSAFYRRELAVDADQRELSLDGLRGVAALMVMTHHAATFMSSFVIDNWGNTRSPLLQSFGPYGVHLFFMLTGYLFWSKARAAHGKLKMAKLWRSRVFRIAPLYFFSVALIMAVALATGKVHVADAGFFKSAWRLLGMGFIPWQDFGNFSVATINAGVVWTLWYEWRFYLALPFIAWFAVGRRVFWFSALMYVSVFCVWCWLQSNQELFLVFIFGMVCPVLLDNETLRAQLRSRLAAIIALATTIALAMWIEASPHTIAFAISMFPVFVVIAAGNTFFGALVRPALRCAGAISYSMYLLHGIVFYVIFTALKAAGLTAWPEIFYWIILAIAGIGISAFCSITYRWIEFPFLSRSHKIAKAISSNVPFPEITQSVH